MNAARRRELSNALASLEAALMIVEHMLGEEQEAHEAISERFPGSDQEAALSSSASALEDAVDQIGDAMAQIEIAIR